MKKVILFLLLIFSAIACDSEKLTPVDDPSLMQEKLPVQESWDSEIYFSENGIVKAILYSDNLKVFDDPRETVLENVKIDFYNEQGEKTSYLTSKRGRVDDISSDMFAIDSVVAISDSGVTLTSDELIWKNKDKKIVTTKFVRIVTEDEIIEGYGLESDQSLSNYVIFNSTYYAKKKK